MAILLSLLLFALLLGAISYFGYRRYARPGRVYELSCIAQIGFSGRFDQRNFDGSAMQMPQAIRPKRVMVC